MCSILLLPLVARCLETIDVCIWCMFVFMPVVVTHCLILHIIIHLHISFYYVHCSFLLFQHIPCPHPSSPHQVIAFTLKKHMDLLFLLSHTHRDQHHISIPFLYNLLLEHTAICIFLIEKIIRHHFKISIWLIWLISTLLLCKYERHSLQIRGI